MSHHHTAVRLTNCSILQDQRQRSFCQVFVRGTVSWQSWAERRWERSAVDDVVVQYVQTVFERCIYAGQRSNTNTLPVKGATCPGAAETRGTSGGYVQGANVLHPRPPTCRTRWSLLWDNRPPSECVCVRPLTAAPAQTRPSISRCSCDVVHFSTIRNRYGAYWRLQPNYCVIALLGKVISHVRSDIDALLELSQCSHDSLACTGFTLVLISPQKCLNFTHSDIRPLKVLKKCLIFTTDFLNILKSVLVLVTSTILWHLENMLTLAVCMYCNECCIIGIIC